MIEAAATELPCVLTPAFLALDVHPGGPATCHTWYPLLLDHEHSQANLAVRVFGTLDAFQWR